MGVYIHSCQQDGMGTEAVADVVRVDLIFHVTSKGSGGTFQLVSTFQWEY